MAAWLGFIPGVGAMYNGQYGKGAMHLAIFVALLAMADHVSDVLYWLVWGWVFYQAFDAYHTAAARRDGQPLPDPFGFNDVGGRLFGGATNRPPTRSAAVPRAVPQQAPPMEHARAEARNSPEAAAWNGENPYNVPYARPAAPPPPHEREFPPAYTAQTPYAPVASTTEASLTGMPTPLEGTRRFPVAALWLIGLGLVFLLGNLLPNWHMNGEWVGSLALGALAVWSAMHRWMRAHTRVAGPGRSLVCVLGLPALLLLCSFLLALDALHVAGLARTWPVLLVFWGAILFAQRLLPSSAINAEATLAATKTHDDLRSSFPQEDEL